VPEGQEERNAATERIADDVGLVEPQMGDERGDVSAISWTSIGRSMSAVQPWPWRSGAMTRWPAASAGTIGPSISPDSSPPWSTITGAAAAVGLVVELILLTSAYWPVPVGLARPFGGGHRSVLPDASRDQDTDRAQTGT
jgi:hypothetical protein